MDRNDRDDVRLVVLGEVLTTRHIRVLHPPRQSTRPTPHGVRHYKAVISEVHNQYSFPPQDAVLNDSSRRAQIESKAQLLRERAVRPRGVV